MFNHLHAALVMTNLACAVRSPDSERLLPLYRTASELFDLLQVEVSRANSPLSRGILGAIDPVHGQAESVLNRAGIEVKILAKGQDPGNWQSEEVVRVARALAAYHLEASGDWIKETRRSYLPSAHEHASTAASSRNPASVDRQI